MKFKARLWAPLCAALALLVGASPAGGFDLTGTWEGKFSCTDFDGAKFTEKFTGSILLVSQNGDVLAASVDNFDFFNGRAIQDTSDPDKGEAVLSQCGTDNLPAAGAPGEIVRAQVKTRPATGQGTLKALSIFEGLTVLPGPQVGTCKWSFKRTATANPNVAACP